MAALGTTREPTGDIVYRQLKTQIEDGALRPGNRLLSVRELRERFNVSHRATLRALERLEQEGYVVRRQGSGTYVRQRSENAEADAACTVRLLQTNVQDYTALFLRPLLAALRDEAAQLRVQLTADHVTPEEGRRILAERKTEAQLWLYPSIPLDFAKVEAPAVFVAHDLEVSGFDWPHADFVTSDSRQGGALAGRHLRECGCNSVVLVGAAKENAPPMPYSRLRLMGFEEGWGEPVPTKDWLMVNGYTPMEGVRIVPAILKRNPLPDAIFADSDDLAQGICHALAAHSITPGKEIKVVGYDGLPPQFPDDPTLTTVAAPLEALGRTALQRAVARNLNPGEASARICLACSLRKGETA